LGDSSIFNLIKQPFFEWPANKYSINDLVWRQDARPSIEIKSNQIIVGEWLLDTGAGIKCMPSQQFRQIAIEKRRPR
jgi:hypothetical protein